MKKIILISIHTIIIIFLISYFLLSYPKFSPELEECNSLYYNSESAVDIVFFSTKETAKKYSDFLLETAPFSENTD